MKIIFLAVAINQRAANRFCDVMLAEFGHRGAEITICNNPSLGGFDVIAFCARPAETMVEIKAFADGYWFGRIMRKTYRDE